MDSVTQSYSVLLVSASAKFMDSVLPLLPERSFSPITKAPDVSSARRCLLERSYDLLIINAPLPDEFGTNFALDICQSTQTGVLLLVRAEQYPDVTARVAPSGVLTLQKPTSPALFSSTLQLLCATRARLRRMEQKTATLEEKMDTLLRHIRLACDYKGERTGMREARKHAAWYFKGEYGSADLRRRAGQLTTYDDLLFLAEEMLSRRS